MTGAYGVIDVQGDSVQELKQGFARLSDEHLAISMRSLKNCAQGSTSKKKTLIERLSSHVIEDYAVPVMQKACQEVVEDRARIK